MKKLLRWIKNFTAGISKRSGEDEYLILTTIMDTMVEVLRNSSETSRRTQCEYLNRFRKSSDDSKVEKFDKDAIRINNTSHIRRW